MPRCSAWGVRSVVFDIRRVSPVGRDEGLAGAEGISGNGLRIVDEPPEPPVRLGGFMVAVGALIRPERCTRSGRPRPPSVPNVPLPALAMAMAIAD